MKLSAYWDLLNKHDWYHAWSDDFKVDQAGIRSCDQLQLLAGESSLHQDLLTGFQNHYFSGKPWNTIQAPKPERPQD